MPDTGYSAQRVLAREGEVSDAEWETRVNLAAAFRVSHHLGWNDTVFNHISARIPDAPDRFLMNPRDLGWHEVTASNLVKLDLDCNVLSDTDVPPNPAGLNFHSAILRLKPEINCTLHIHALHGVVVSAMKDGLMHFDQSSCALYGQVAYHEFEGLAEDEDEGPRIVRDLGEKFAMIMWNHGLLTVGRTIGEAFAYMRRLTNACETQVTLMSTGAEVRRLPEAVVRHTYEQMSGRRGNEPAGETEWPMALRLAERLDPAFRT